MGWIAEGEPKELSTHEQLVKLFEEYIEDSEKFETKSVKQAAARARKTLMNITKLAKVRRAEIQDKKNSM
tara:strand:+ start:413 stop:622 length:210 start_codon:yes stop_codon:yes gene_type:complete